MIQILTYNEIDHAQWQALIAQSPYATWFQTPQAYEFYMSVSHEMTLFVYGVAASPKSSPKGKDLQLLGLVVGYVTRARNPLTQFFTRRAIIIGGPLLAEDISEEALTALLNSIKKLPSLQGRGGERLPIYIEIRNLHDYSPWHHAFEQAEFSYQPHLNIQVTCNAAHTMSEQRIRQVKKAFKNGAIIAEAQTEQEVRDWYKILKQLYRTKVRTPLWSEEFFVQFYRNGVGKYLLVKYNEKVIGGMMCPILDGKTIYEWYVCGLDEEYRELCPSVMATYAAIEYAKENGLPLFDFMGAGKPDVPYGVRDFKMEFGGELVEYGRYLHICKPLLYKIGKIAVKIMKKGKIFGFLEKI